MTETEENGSGLRTPAEYALAAVTIVTTVAFAVALVFGPALAAAWRLSRDGVTAYSIALTVVAVVWSGLLVYAIVQDRETRGWLVFGLVGWLVLLVGAARSLARRAVVRDR